jgi:hypothetical protein
MPEDALVTIEVDVHSNVDRLSSMAVHEITRRLVDRMVDLGESFMRTNILMSIKGNYGTTGELFAAVETHPTISAGDVIEAAVGIPPIEREMPFDTTGDSRPEDYPIFHDKGTETPTFPATKTVMKFEGMFGDTVHAKSVRGQEETDYSGKTYEEMFAVLPHEAEQFEREIKALV